MNTCKYFSRVQDHSDQWPFPLEGPCLGRAEKKLKVHLVAFWEGFSYQQTHIVKAPFLVYVMTTEQASSTNEDHDEEQWKAPEVYFDFKFWMNFQTDFLIPHFEKYKQQKSQSSYWTAVMRKELSLKAKLSIYQSIYDPMLTFSLEFSQIIERMKASKQNEFHSDFLSRWGARRFRSLE